MHHTIWEYIKTSCIRICMPKMYSQLSLKTISKHDDHYSEASSDVFFFLNSTLHLHWSRLARSNIRGANKVHWADGYRKYSSEKRKKRKRVISQRVTGSELKPDITSQVCRGKAKANACLQNPGNRPVIYRCYSGLNLCVSSIKTNTVRYKDTLTASHVILDKPWAWNLSSKIMQQQRNAI